MQFLPGSHKRGLLRHRHLEDPIQNLLSADEPFNPSTAIACPLKAGGAPFHHSETLHYTAPNTTKRVRMAFPMEFQLVPVAARRRKSCPGWTNTAPGSGRRP
jgi:ectoine hydroxylase-related dioxygenase (phytanoyl-CoA dioxygenase family)